MSKISWPGWETVRFICNETFGPVYEIQRDVRGGQEKAALKVISISKERGDLENLYRNGYDDERIRDHLKSIATEYSLIMNELSSCVNIVNCKGVHYVLRDDGVSCDIFIKSELLTPLTKALLIEKRTVLPEEMVVHLAEDICSALDTCSKYNIIHWSDVKPQNIFVSKHGDYKLGEVGLTKTMEKALGGINFGAFFFTAPEVYYAQPCNISASIYSLGLVLYWLLNEQRRPLLPPPPLRVKPGMDETAWNRRFSGEPIPPPAHGSDTLKRIVLKACAYNPVDRYQSPADMLQDLKEYRVWSKLKKSAPMGEFEKDNII